MPDIKELLISPFSLVPSNPSKPSKKNAQRPVQMCKCDSDNEDNDFGMAPECAFICSLAHSSRNKTTKKRKQPSLRTKKTRRRTASLPLHGNA
jgi:hypothetical protein